jgi:hypothetical protein
MYSMIIANRLTDGLVVFFVDSAQWIEDIAAAKLIDNEQDAQKMLELALQDQDNCIIVDPNLIEVEVLDGQPRPTAIREAIRAFGPSLAARTDAIDAAQE